MVLEFGDGVATSGEASLINSGHMASDLLFDYFISEFIEYNLVGRFLGDGAVKASGKTVLKKGAEEAVEQGAKQGAKAVAQKAAVKQASTGTKAAFAAAAKPAASAGAKSSVISASGAWNAVTIAFAVTMLTLDIIDKAGFNQLLGKKDLEDYGNLYKEAFEDLDLDEKVELPIAVSILDVDANGNVVYSEWGELYMQYVNEYLTSEYGIPENWQDSLQEIEIQKPTNFDDVFRYMGGTPEAKASYIKWGISFLVIILIILMFLIFKK